MKICLETSTIIGFLQDEPDCQSIERLLVLAKAGLIELFVSDFAWQEIYKLLDEKGNTKKECLKQVAKHLPKAARIGEWRLGFDVLAHNDSIEIEKTLSHSSRSDTEQFLSYAALDVDFFVTKDKHYLKKSVRSELVKEYGFQIGTADECIGWLKQKGVF